MDTNLFSYFSTRFTTPSHYALEFYNNFPVMEVFILLLLTLITIFRRQLSSNDQYRIDCDTLKNNISMTPTVSSILDELIDASKDTTSSIKKYINTRNLLSKQNKNYNVIEKNHEYNFIHQFKNTSSFIFPIPNELLLHIITYLNIVDLHKLMIVSNASLKLLKNDFIWKQLWFKNFGPTLWKDKCIIEIKLFRNIEWNYDDDHFTPVQGWYKFYIEFSYCWMNWLLAGLCTVQNCYVGLNGKLYYLSPFLDDHPGSPETLLESSGCDCTAHYTDIGHSKYATLLANNYLIFTPTDYSIKFSKDINKIKIPEIILLHKDEENIKKVIQRNTNNAFSINEFNVIINGIENINVLNKLDRKVYGLGVMDCFEVCPDLVSITKSSVGKYNLECNALMHHGQCKSFYDPLQQQWYCWWSCCGDAHKIIKKNLIHKLSV